MKTLADRLAKQRGGNSGRDRRKWTPINYSTRWLTYQLQLRTTSFWKKAGDMEVKALGIMMHHSLAEKQVEIPGDDLRDV